MQALQEAALFHAWSCLLLPVCSVGVVLGQQLCAIPASCTELQPAQSLLCAQQHSNHVQLLPAPANSLRAEQTRVGAARALLLCSFLDGFIFTITLSLGVRGPSLCSTACLWVSCVVVGSSHRSSCGAAFLYQFGGRREQEGGKSPSESRT